ncbi:Protein of unknown function [Gryllus bimaculatus]|nr:Protein of unknown function [Gryllus bimaculatus]
MTLWSAGRPNFGMWYMLGASSEDERLALLLRRQQLEAEALALRHRSELAAFHHQSSAQVEAQVQADAQKKTMRQPKAAQTTPTFETLAFPARNIIVDLPILRHS